ncbi:MAG: hypothetical protein VKO64_08300 [Candidatus Sericytochromatia bacterium]|nr:hypothetical protein [Candidatus Sericytochromatia bacterium]
MSGNISRPSSGATGPLDFRKAKTGGLNAPKDGLAGAGQPPAEATSPKPPVRRDRNEVKASPAESANEALQGELDRILKKKRPGKAALPGAEDKPPVSAQTLAYPEGGQPAKPPIPPQPLRQIEEWLSPLVQQPPSGMQTRRHPEGGQIGVEKPDPFQDFLGNRDG